MSQSVEGELAAYSSPSGKIQELEAWLSKTVKVRQLAGGGKAGPVFWLNCITEQRKVVF